MCTVNITMSQAKAWPTKVDRRSTMRISLSIGRDPGRGTGRRLARARAPRRTESPAPAGRAWRRGGTSAGGGSGGRLAREVVVERHPEIDRRIVVPASRARREGALRFQHLLEERVLGRALLDHLVPDLQLLLQDGVRRLVELDVVVLLQLDVVGRIAVGGFPGHVGAGGLRRVGQDML